MFLIPTNLHIFARIYLSVIFVCVSFLKVLWRADKLHIPGGLEVELLLAQQACG